MSGNGQELEVKFLVKNLETIENRLQALGAALVQARVYENNLRFDRADGVLSSAQQVLRLRVDTEARLTFKGPGMADSEVRQRQELEFTAGDFDMARQFLEALGYGVIFRYEKYRAMYQFEQTLVTLDEMPYGFFIEIEGPDGTSIQRAAQQLEVDWQRRILDSYTALFERVKANLGLVMRDLSFENFQDIQISPEDLGLAFADRSA